MRLPLFLIDYCCVKYFTFVSTENHESASPHCVSLSVIVFIKIMRLFRFSCFLFTKIVYAFPTKE